MSAVHGARIDAAGARIPRSSDIESHLQCSGIFDQPAEDPAESRQKLCYHLSQLFPPQIVEQVMVENPAETDPQRLCSRILAKQSGFS